LRNKDGTPKTADQVAAEYIAAQEKTKSINIRIASGDLDLARKQAEAKGIRYQTYIRMLLHESLQKKGRFIISDAGPIVHFQRAAKKPKSVATPHHKAKEGRRPSA
jgi:hypothetical protein